MRSKVKRRNRTEFRSTIGKVAVDKNMDTIQAKLQECISKGSMNSFDKVSKQLHGDNNDSDMEDHDNTAPDIDAMDTEMTSTGKSGDKVPVKKSRKKKHLLPNTAGQTGAKLARQKINKLKRNGKMRKGQMVRKVTVKRKKGQVSF